MLCPGAMSYGKYHATMKKGIRTMLDLPFMKELESSDNILIAGAGGGYDVFSGLPLYFGLVSAGKRVSLANLSFTRLSLMEGERLTPTMLTVAADTVRNDWYFPEQYLCEWLRDRQKQDVPIYCFERTGVKPLRASYETLVDKLRIDTVILVDGGTDSLMRGDEDGLGTPQEDIASIAAVSELDADRKMMACLGFGVDNYHGVSNALTFEAISELTRSGGFLGMISLLDDMPEVRKYREATEYVLQCMPMGESIVSNSILSALEGRYGNYHSTVRTRGSFLWINPLMPVYWWFRLDVLADRILYLESMKNTHSYADVNQTIATFRQSYSGRIRYRHSIPD
jgi:hypothetical protein